MILGWLLAGCGPQVTVEVGLDTCAAHGVQEVLEPAELQVDQLCDPEGEPASLSFTCRVVVARPGRPAPCGGAFAPLLEADGTVLRVVEDWTGGDEACTACATPWIGLVEPPAGHWEVRWFDGPEHAVPAASVGFEVE